MLALWKSRSPQRTFVISFGPPRSIRAASFRRARSITVTESSRELAT